MRRHSVNTSILINMLQASEKLEGSSVLLTSKTKTLIERVTMKGEMEMFKFHPVGTGVFEVPFSADKGEVAR